VQRELLKIVQLSSTVARYFTQRKLSIQKPYTMDDETYLKESESRFESGELYEKIVLRLQIV
jgi:carboxyl-terminal processing protease